MFGFLARRRKAKEAIEKYVKLLGGHIVEAFQSARIAVGNSPYIIDETSRADLYLLGYIGGLLECAKKQVPELAAYGRWFWHVMLLTLFGREHVTRIIRLHNSKTMQDPQFEMGVQNGYVEGLALLTDNRPSGFLQRYLESRKVDRGGTGR